MSAECEHDPHRIYLFLSLNARDENIIQLWKSFNTFLKPQYSFLALNIRMTRKNTFLHFRKVFSSLLNKFTFKIFFTASDRFFLLHPQNYNMNSKVALFVTLSKRPVCASCKYELRSNNNP